MSSVANRSVGVTAAWIAASVAGAICTGWMVSRGLGLAVVGGIAVAGLTWVLPWIVPAILLVGPGFLHLFTYVLAGGAGRSDVLSDPLRYLAVLGALFAPPLLRAVTRSGDPIRDRFLARSTARRWFFVGMMLLWATLVIRLVGTPSPIYGVTKVAGFAAFSIFPALFVLLTASTPKDCERILNAVAVVGGAWLLLSLSIAIWQGNLDLYRADPGELLGGTTQAGGGLGERAGIVAFAAVGGAMFDRRWRLPRLAIAGLAMAIIVLSGHRASAFAFLAGGVGLLIALRRSGSGILFKPRTVLVVGVLILGITLGWRSAPSLIRERFADPFQSVSFQDRLDLQARSLEAWRASPILGNGTGSSAALIGGGDQPGFGAVQGVYPHNVTVELLAETGVVGAGIYLFTIIGLLVKAYRGMPRVGRGGWGIPVLFAMVIQAFVYSQGSADLTIQNDVWILCSLLAVSLSVLGTAHAGARSQLISGRTGEAGSTG